MKRLVKISGMILVIMIAAAGNISAQRGMMGMRGMGRPDTTRLRRMEHMQMRGDSTRGQRGFGQLPWYWGGIMSQPFNGMRRGSGMGLGFGMQPGMMRVKPGMMQGRIGIMQGRPGMMQGRTGMMQGRPGMRRARPGMPNIESIPNLTEKQKQDINSLRQKQQDEMKKFRDDTQVKMEAMRKANREKILNLLNGEQKKYFEEHFPGAIDKK
jgi:hypothetical protein